MSAVKGWFLIQSVLDGSVISCDRSLSNEYIRSQVYVYPTPRYVDEEYWTWKENTLQNKKTGLVLDIRKGRLRLIEDTEVCLYHAKPREDASNQQWAIRAAKDDFGREKAGYFIYSLSNEEWVIDLNIHAAGSEEGAKLLVYPTKSFDSENQQWEFVPEDTFSPSPVATETDFQRNNVVNKDDYTEECRRCSQSSTNSHTAEITMKTLKECHQRAYLENDPHLSNRAIAMAAAYFAIMQWKLDNNKLDQSLLETRGGDLVLNELQQCAAKQASALYDRSDTLSSDRTTASKMAIAIVAQFYNQQPYTP